MHKPTEFRDVFDAAAVHVAGLLDVVPAEIRSSAQAHEQAQWRPETTRPRPLGDRFRRQEAFEVAFGLILRELGELGLLEERCGRHGDEMVAETAISEESC